VRAALAAWRQVLSRPFRAILWKSVALTVALLGLVWFGLTRLFAAYLKDNPLSTQYPVLDGLCLLPRRRRPLRRAGLYPPGRLGAGRRHLQRRRGRDRRAHRLSGRPAGAAALGRAVARLRLRFAGLSLLVNLAALTLFFIPLVNVAAFFAANAYLLGREYFELAAGRFRPPAEAAEMRSAFRPTVLMAGAMLAGLVLSRCSTFSRRSSASP
jgi:CysZ protein